MLKPCFVFCVDDRFTDNTKKILLRFFVVILTKREKYDKMRTCVSNDSKRLIFGCDISIYDKHGDRGNGVSAKDGICKEGPV